MSPDLFLKLADLDLSKEQMAGVIDVLKCLEAEHEAKVEKSREKARARLQKWRDKQPGNVSKRLTTSPDVSQRLTSEGAPGEDNLPSKKITGNKEGKKETRASHEAAFRAELAPDLDAELLDGIIQVRRDKRGQVTGLSARCFRDDAAECGMSVHDAAKACVTSSWITVKPHYFHSRAGPTGQPRGVVGAALRIIESRTNGSEIFPRNHGHVEQLPTGAGDRPGAAVEDVRSGIGRRFSTSDH